MIASIQIETLLRPLVDKRVYPDLITDLDDATAPYIVYQEISNVPEVTLDGPTGHEWVHVQIDVYHTEKLACTYLANKVIETLGDNIKPSVYGGKQTLPEDGLYRTIIEYEFWQTAPTEPTDSTKE